MEGRSKSRAGVEVGINRATVSSLVPLASSRPRPNTRQPELTSIDKQSSASSFVTGVESMVVVGPTL